MSKIMNMVLNMVIVSLLVVFLLTYLLHGEVHGGKGIWQGIGKNVTVEGQKEIYNLSETGKEWMNGTISELVCSYPMVALNQSYLVNELFKDRQQRECYLELKDVRLQGKSVMARGKEEFLLTEEVVPPVIFDEEEQRITFTKNGDYEVILRVGTEFGRKPGKDIYIRIPAISDSPKGKKL